MSFFIGDTPILSVIELDEDTLDDATAATATIHAPGQTPAVAVATIDEGSETVRVDWPDDYPLTGSGVGRILLRLTYTTGEARTVAVQRFVVEALDGWYTLWEAREDWAQAPHLDHQAFELLQMAREQCLEYAPLAEGAAVPGRHRQAQLMQARNIWNSQKVDPATGGIDGESFVITPHPLDWMIKQILRPNRGGLITGTEEDD